MRNILSMLSEIRQLQLTKAGAAAERLAESAAKFVFIDQSLSGYKATGSFGSEVDKLSEVMTSGDFTYAIGEFVQREMLPGYQQKGFAFEPLVKMDTLPNYMPVTRYQRRSELDDLEYVGEKGEARPGRYDDATKKQYRVFKWKKQFEFSMEALVNDDLGYFSDLTRDMGRASRRTLEKFVSRFFTNATTINRLTGLGALYSTTGRLTTARISEARMAFNQRTDTRGEPISAALKFLVFHSGLVDQVATIQASTLVPELATNAQNVVRGTFTPIEDPYITGTAPNLPWYAFTDPGASGIIPFVLARRQGFSGPLILRKKSDIESVTSLLGAGAAVPPILGDFSTSNLLYEVWDEFGTYIDGTEGNLFDYRGAYYSSGTAA